MNFTCIDFEKWNRGQMFYYFSKMAPTSYSMTVNVDITEMRNAIKTAGIKFFPAYLWVITKNLNAQTEFKIAEKDGKLGYYDTLTPLYATFHDDDNTFSFMWTEYNESFPKFYNAYIENKTKYSENHGVLSQPQTPPPPNAYTVSCIPWVHFQHFAVHSYKNEGYYFPSLEAGRFSEENGRIIMPLSITCHHATTDGYHVDKFLQSLRSDMESFKKYL